MFSIIPINYKISYLKGELKYAPDERKIEIANELNKLNSEKEKILEQRELEEKKWSDQQELKNKQLKQELEKERLEERSKSLEYLQSSMNKLSDTLQEQIDEEKQIIDEFNKAFNIIKTKEELLECINQSIPILNNALEEESDILRHISIIFMKKFIELFDVNSEYKLFREILEKIDFI